MGRSAPRWTAFWTATAGAWNGSVGKQEILPAMARCDVLLQTSRNEGTPVALIQGMAAAPALCLDRGGRRGGHGFGRRQTAGDGARWYANGVLRESRCRQRWLARWRMLADDRTLVARMGLDGRALAVAAAIAKRGWCDNMDALYRE